MLRSIVGAGFIMLLARAACGQPVAPAFEVASIKPTPPSLRNKLRIDRCANGGRYFSGGAPLGWTIAWGFRSPDAHISGLPKWAETFDDAYELEAKADGPASPDECRLMIQSLLVDRFKLSIHREKKDVAVYDLTIANNMRKNLARLHEVTHDLTHEVTHELTKDTIDGGGVRINQALQQAPAEPEAVPGWPMSRLASYLSDIPELGRTVVDKTGLAGSYSFALDFSRPDGDDAPRIFSALQEQLGLKLESAESQEEFLVIDHIERPSENQ